MSPHALLDKAEEEERFQLFLVEMPDSLERLQKDASLKGLKLDYSLNSLDALERYCTSIVDPSDDAREQLIGRAARYLGEVIRANYGGNWRLSISDPHDGNYGMPVISGHSSYDIDFPPHQIVRNFLLRRKNGMLRIAVINDIEPEKLDITPEA